MAARDSDEEVTRRLTAQLPASAAFTATGLLAARSFAAVTFIAFSVLLTYTCVVHGSPFRSDLLVPWMVATLWDYYITLLPCLIWVSWRHRASPATAALLVVYLCCLGSAALWSYITLTLFRIRVGEPVTRLLGPF